MAWTLPIVEELLHRGHHVNFITTDAGAERVVGVEVEAMSYAARTPEVITAASDAAAYEPIAARRSSAPTASIGPATPQFTGYRPDLLLHDAAVGARADRLADRWGVPTVRLFRTFTEDESDRPDEASRVSRILRELTEPGGPAVRIGAVRVLRDPSPALPDRSSSPVDDPTLVLMPREFQPSDDRYAFVGPCLDSRTHEETWHPAEPRRPLLLVAPGQLPGPRHTEFLRTCVSAVAGLPWQVVITVTGDADLTGLRPLPPNVEIHREGLSTPAALRYADAIVAPSGMRTVLEALYFGVPLVAVPMRPDQHAGAYRVAALRLGRTVHPQRMSASVLRDAATKVMGNAGIHARAAHMRLRVRAAGGTAGAVNRIESHLEGRDRGGRRNGGHGGGWGGHGGAHAAPPRAAPQVHALAWLWPLSVRLIVARDDALQAFARLVHLGKREDLPPRRTRTCPIGVRAQHLDAGRGHRVGVTTLGSTPEAQLCAPPGIVRLVAALRLHHHRHRRPHGLTDAVVAAV